MKSDTMAAVKPLSSLARDGADQQPEDPGSQQEAGTAETQLNTPAPSELVSPAEVVARTGPQLPDDVAESDTMVAATADSLGQSDTLHATSDEALATPSQGVVRRGRTTGRREGLTGRTLAQRYTIVGLLGKGGMSEVYEARHELLKKTVAIKVLKEELASSRAALERFHREAIAAAAIGDPHIVDVTDYGFTDDGDAYLVMELLEGRDLRKALRQDGAMAPGRAVAIARQILRGLRAAHQREIIHRDLKAENVFITARDDVEFVKLLDFGISKVRTPGEESGDKQSLTSTGMVMGTPQYIAPEQAHAHSDLDHRVDIYAMGVILYEMLTGDLPFDGETALELMMKHVQEEPEPPRRRRPDLQIPAELEAVVLKALEKKREDRYESAQAMLDALPGSDALSGGYASIGTARAPGASPAPRRSKWTAMLVGLLLIGAGLGYVVYRMVAKEPDRPVAVLAPVDAAASPIIKADARVAPPDLARRPDRAVAKPDSALSRTNAKAEGVSVALEVTPRGASIRANGKLLDKPLLRGAPGTKVRLRIAAKGYYTLTREIILDPKRSRLPLRLRKRGSTAGKKPKPGDLKSNPYR